MFSKVPRCQTRPLPDDQVAFGIDGRERLRWHAGRAAPRPFLYPLIGPSGLSLTRMGHPGAPNHDHHRSIWFAHQQVLGIDFWSDGGLPRIRQHHWLAYEDGDEQAAMAVELGWYDGHDPQPLLTQQLIVAIQPGSDEEVFVEIQTTFVPTADSLELQQTNFGLLAVRVAKEISAVFGDGILSGPGGLQTESQLFGKAWPWVDYSGSIDRGVREGITYFDHPSNGRFPNKWHVRDDGWMGVSVCRDAPMLLMRGEPKTFRYLLHAHRGEADPIRADQIAEAFHRRAALVVMADRRPHRTHSITREA